MELHDLRCFVACCELRSVSAAARHVGRVQPAVSNAIARLERELQLTLLHRHSTGVDPTPAGLEFVRHARTVLGAVERATAEMTVYRDRQDGDVTELRGEVRIGVAPPFAPSVTTGLLRELRRIAPRVTARLSERGTTALLDAVETRQLDLGILWLPVRRVRLQTEGLGAFRLAVVSVSDHPVALRERATGDPGASTTLSLRELVDEPWIVFPPGSAPRLWVEGACMRAGFAPQVAREVETWAEAKVALEAGLGVTLLPPVCVALEIEGGTLHAAAVADAGHGIVGLVANADAPVTAVHARVRSILMESGRSSG